MRAGLDVPLNNDTGDDARTPPPRAPAMWPPGKAGWGWRRRQRGHRAEGAAAAADDDDGGTRSSRSRSRSRRSRPGAASLPLLVLALSLALLLLLRLPPASAPAPPADSGDAPGAANAALRYRPADPSHNDKQPIQASEGDRPAPWMRGGGGGEEAAPVPHARRALRRRSPLGNHAGEWSWERFGFSTKTPRRDGERSEQNQAPRYGFARFSLANLCTQRE